MKFNSNKNNEGNPFTQVNDNDFLNNNIENQQNYNGIDNNNLETQPTQDYNNTFDNSQPIQNGGNFMGNNIPMNNQSKKKKSLLPIIIGIVVVLVIAVVFVVLGGKNNEKPIEETPVVVDNPEVEKENKEEKEVNENNESDENKEIEEDNNEEPNMEDSKILAFEDNMVGIKFNYDSELYMKKNVEEIFNTLKTVIPEDRNDFNIFTDKLNGTLNICKLTTGKADGLYINVSVIPFELEKATTTLKIDGTTVIENETIGIVDFNTEELIKNYDIQIKQTVEQMGCTIVEYGESTVIEIGEIEKEGKKLQGIFTSRIYTGPVEATTSTGTVDVVQCTIPVGKNAILITAVTDGRPIEIDKAMLVNEIAESFKIIAEMPKENVEETEKTE